MNILKYLLPCITLLFFSTTVVYADDHDNKKYYDKDGKKYLKKMWDKKGKKMGNKKGKWKQGQMLGGRNDLRTFISRSKRARIVVLVTSDGSSLTATMRSFFTNRARYTSPMPPSPMRSSNSKGQIQRF